MVQPTPVLITVTGPDKPGVTSVLMGALAAQQVSLLDVEQVVINDRLTLGVMVSVDTDPEEVQDVVEQAMGSIGMDVIVEVGGTPAEHRPSTHAVVLLGSPVTARAFRAVAAELAGQGGNIDSIRGVADYPVTGLELMVSVGGRNSVAADADLRKGLAGVAAKHGVDIAIERGGLARRAKRLVVFDVDSTLIQGEVIEMLAAHAGREAEVAAVTEAAMRGELDFAGSLHARVATLAGLPVEVVAEFDKYLHDELDLVREAASAAQQPAMAAPPPRRTLRFTQERAS